MCNGCGAFTYPAERYINTACDCFLPRELMRSFLMRFFFSILCGDNITQSLDTSQKILVLLETAVATPP